MAVQGCVRLCEAMQGCAKLCMAVHEWSRPYGCGLAFAFVHWVAPIVQFLNYPYFVLSYCGGFMGTLLET